MLQKVYHPTFNDNCNSNCPIPVIFISPAGAVAKYCDENVCVCVCLSTRRRYLRNHTRDLYQIFGACCLWSWLSPLPASLIYVMYFRLCGWHHAFSTMGVQRYEFRYKGSNLLKFTYLYQHRTKFNVLLLMGITLINYFEITRKLK